MFKLKQDHVIITNEDVDALKDSEFKNVGIADDKGYIELFLLTEDQSKAVLNRN